MKIKITCIACQKKAKIDVPSHIVLTTYMIKKMMHPLGADITKDGHIGLCKNCLTEIQKKQDDEIEQALNN